MKIEEGNIFSFAGIVETPESFNGAVALYDHLWALKPELREKLIRSWIRILENSLEDNILDKIAPEYADGTAIVIVDDENPIEIRQIPDNVIPFGSKNVKRIEKKKIEN